MKKKGRFDNPDELSGYEYEQYERYLRALELADKRYAEADALWESAREERSIIPMGQPILVGHHSESRHRNLLKRTDARERRAMEAWGKSDYYKDKARSILHNTAISSDDPEAVTKLKEKLHKEQSAHAFVKSINKIVRSRRKKYTDEEKIRDLIPLLHGDKDPKATAAKLLESGWTGELGIASYISSNRLGRIAAIKKRIIQVEALAKLVYQEVEIDGVTLILDPDINRIQLYFPSKPPKEFRRRISRLGFNWSRAKQAWQRKITNAAECNARQAIKEYNALEAA